MPSDSIGQLLGPLRADIRDNPEPGALVPHVYTFSSVLNSQARIYSYRYDEALRHLPSNALAMRRDAFIESLIQERILPNAQRPWSIRVPKPKDPIQAKVRDVVTQAIKAIPRFNAMREYLLEAVWYGRYGAQINWCQKKILDKPTWTVHSHRPVNGDKVHYGWDGIPAVAISPLTRSSFPDNLTVATADRGMTLLKLLRPEHRRQFIVHRHLVTDADYFEPEMAGGISGVGLRSKVYWNWWLRDEMLSWAVDFMQKVGTLGLLVFNYEDGNDTAKAAAETAAARASNETALTMPMPPGQGQKQTASVTHIKADAGGINALMAIISEYFERHIERLFIGQPSSGGGSEASRMATSAGAAMHADTKYQIVKWDAANLDETLTIDLVGQILALNFPDGIDFPVEFVSAVNNPEDAAKMQSITQGAALGCTFKRDEVMALIGMSVPEDGDDVVGGVQQTPGNPEGIDEGLTEPGQGLTHNAVVERRNGSGSGDGLEKEDKGDE